MITPEMIRDGLKFGAVAIIDSPNGDGAVCQIGESWFYFGGMEAETQTGEEYVANTPEEDVVRKICDALYSFRETPETYGDEYEYYERTLRMAFSEITRNED